MDQSDQIRQIAAIKTAASRMMHLHYCENDVDGVISYFDPRLVWIGAGEEEYSAHFEETVSYFLRYRGSMPKCSIQDEAYDVLPIGPDFFLCTGRMWIATDPHATKMCLKVHQRVTFLFQWREDHPMCLHIHCSNPYSEMLEGETFPTAIGRQSYDYIQERLRILEEESRQRERQMEVIMASIPGGLKSSRDDETYSYSYVSPEAAALFGYTVEEFLEMTGGSAIGATYPPDLPKALDDCRRCFQDGNDTYSLKYRIPCKDGSLKWVLDSGRKTLGNDGQVLIHSLYLDITKEELAAQEILRQQKLLQSIYDTVPCGILRFSRIGDRYELISMNRAALELASYESEAEFRASWNNGMADSVLAEDQPALCNSNNSLHKAGDQHEISYRVRRKDGTIRWLNGFTTLLSSSPQECIIQRTMYDITDRRQLLEQLESEREMYRVAMESSSVVMYEYRVDEDTFISYEPQPDSGISGSVVRRELQNCRVALQTEKIAHPDDVQSIINNICLGEAKPFEARFYFPDRSEPAWFRCTGKAIFKNGRLSRVVGTMQNIQHEKEAMSANQAELHMHQSALQALSAMYLSIYYIDLPGDRYYAVSPSDCPSQAYSSGSFYTEFFPRFIALLDPETRVRLHPYADPARFSQYLSADGQRLETEFRYWKSPEKYIWLRLEFHIISTENGTPKHLVATFRDITQTRQHALERQRKEDQSRQALEEAYASANRANQAKSNFLSKMSHDMRTPMNAIMGMTAIAQQNLSDLSRVGDCLAKIQLSSRHLLELINEVLDMSKIENGSISLNESVLDLYQLLQQTVDMIRSDVERKGHSLQVETDHVTHTTVRGDPVRIQQILLNLLSNAVKYTPDGGHITLTLRENDLPSNSVGCYVFRVEDDGMGMTPEFQKRLFLPFERAEDSRVSQIQGTGLGMAITQNLVHMMNGSIQVDSSPNQGTCFTVTLNLQRAQPQERPSSPYSDTDLSQEAFHSSARILLVEDNDLNREIARDLLESAGLTITEAADGAQALELFRQSAPGCYQLILMDIQMPVMDGHQATRAIRSLDRPDAACIPIIALTANAFAEDVLRARQSGMNEHLSKPLEIAELTRTLKRWLP